VTASEQRADRAEIRPYRPSDRSGGPDVPPGPTGTLVAALAI